MGAFLVGCAAPSLIGMTIPSARAGGPDKVWEYFCAEAYKPATRPEALAVLNKAGAEGWELAIMGHEDGTVCFKRASNPP